MKSLLVLTLCGLLAGFAVGAAEVVILISLSSNMFFNYTELVWTAAWAIGISMGAGMLSALVLAALMYLIAAIQKINSKLHGFLWTIAITATILWFPTYLVLSKLTAGPMVSRIRFISFIAIAGSVLVSLGAGAIFAWFLRFSARSKHRSFIIGLTGLAAAGSCYVVDAIALVRLYPIFHYSLTVMTYVIGSASFYITLRPEPKEKHLKKYAIAAIVALAVFGYCLAEVRNTQNARFVLKERSASIGDVLLTANYIFKPTRSNGLDQQADTQEDEKQEQVRGIPTIVRPGSDLILLTIDAMRYDSLKMLGAKRSIAPNLDALAENSVVFSRGYTASPHTSYAVASLMTGKYVRPLFDIPGAPAIHETWPQILSRFQYETAAFYTNAVFFIDRTRFEPYMRLGFGFNIKKVGYDTSPNDRANELIAFMKQKKGGGRPLFAWVHFFDPHEPYDSKCLRFGNEPRDRYDCEIWSVDGAVGKILDYLNSANNDAIVIITADHGEEFQDHGGQYHGTTLYDEQVRVPIVIKIPGVEHKIVDEPVNLVDLLGTCLEILDIPVPARVRSKSMTGLIQGRKNRTAFSEIPGKLMVADSEYKLICQDDMDLCELYDLKNDPKEIRSIASVHKEIVSKLKAQLMAWRRSHAKYELRPINAEGALDGRWPEALRKAISKEEYNSVELFNIIENDNRLDVRRKAAEILYEVGAKEKVGNPKRQIDDPEIASWLAALRLKSGELAAVDELSLLLGKLEPSVKIWRTAVLDLAGAGAKSLDRELIALASDSSAPNSDRISAVRFIGMSGKKNLTASLIPLIDEFQLTMEIATALGQLKNRRSVNTLIKRLLRERFQERESVIIAALKNIGDRSAKDAIASKLEKPNPPREALETLVHWGFALKSGYRIKPKNGTKTIVLYSGIRLDTPIHHGLKKIDRVVISPLKGTGENEIALFCDNRETARAPIVDNDQEMSLELNLSFEAEHLSLKSCFFRAKQKEMTQNLTAAFVGE